jgi:hypothetical protein
MYDATNRGAVDVKWWVLEFSPLLSSALKYCGLPQQEEPLGKLLPNAQRNAKLRPQVAKNTYGKVRPVAIRSQI